MQTCTCVQSYFFRHLFINLKKIKISFDAGAGPKWRLQINKLAPDGSETLFNMGLKKIYTQDMDRAM